MELTFEWDSEKAKENLDKHKVSFQEAKTIYNDPFLWIFPDTEHSDIEQRYIGIGCSERGRILVVIHTERGESIRIISCRKATTSEQKDYEETNN